MKTLPQRVAFVTGAGSGIGRATALAFAKAGAGVACIGVTDAHGEETVRLIERASGQALYVRADVAIETEVERAVAATVERFGRLDWASNNAAVSGPQSIDVPLDEYQRVMDINLRGVWLCMKHQIREMRRVGGGAIVNASSIAGLRGSRWPIYSASKHAIIGLSKSAALAHAGDGIRVNVVCPGQVDDTGMSDQIVAEMAATYGDADAVKRVRDAAVPIGRSARPDEIAAAIVWLCSDAASYVTGHTMVIDGGITASSGGRRRP